MQHELILMVSFKSRTTEFLFSFIQLASTFPFSQIINFSSQWYLLWTELCPSQIYMLKL